MKAEHVQKRFLLTDKNRNKETIDFVKPYKTSSNKGLFFKCAITTCE